MTKHTPEYDPNCYRCRVESGKAPAGVRPDELCTYHTVTRIAELEAELRAMKGVHEAHYRKWRKTAENLHAEREKVELLREALTNIHDYGIDRDGETTAEKLGELVDELVQIAREALAVTTQRRPNG